MCTPNQHKLCDNLDCEICADHSFLSNIKHKLWSPKNTVTPRQVCKSSGKAYLFDCDICEHEFSGKLNQVSLGVFCPYCSSKKLCKNTECEWCFNLSFASHFRSANFSGKNKIDPRYLFKNSNNKFIFECECGHFPIMSLHTIVSNNHWCGYCCSAQKKLCEDEKCVRCENMSFLNNERAIYWSKKNSKTPRQVLKNSHNKYLFDCPCGHEIEVALDSITINNSWCKFCCYPQQGLCTDINCQHCFSKSFISHPRSANLSKDNNISPRQILKGSQRKYKFECDRCLHTFNSSICSIVAGIFCPYCSGNKICFNKDCVDCLNSSFESNYQSKFWSPKNKISPREIARCSQKKFIFNCEDGHEFISSLGNISNRNSWCPICKHKTEKKFFKWFENNNINIISQVKFNWCTSKNDRPLPYDFYIENLKLIIELDGEQHFKKVGKWKAPEEQTKIDVYKMKQALENGISIIRILQVDVWNDKNNWEEELLAAIKQYDQPTVIYINDNKLYDQHKADLNLLLNPIENKIVETITRKIKVIKTI